VGHPKGRNLPSVNSEYFWKDVLNKEEDNDYLKYWEEELTKSFIAIRTQNNAYFLKRRYEK